MYALKHEYDVICVNETWLDNSVNNHEIDLDGYDLIRKDRNRHGGGVATFIRNTINYKIRSDIMPENLETITVDNHGYQTKGKTVSFKYIVQASKYACKYIYRLRIDYPKNGS